MFTFTALCYLAEAEVTTEFSKFSGCSAPFKSIYIFQILMKKYFARAKGDKNISSLPKGTFNYVVIAVVGYWIAIDICGNGN